MTILFYTELLDDVGKRLLEVICKANRQGQVEVHQKIDGLHHRLCQLTQKPAVIILRAPNRECLNSLLAENKLMRDANIILVLPAWDQEMTSLGHLFRPRFLTFEDNSFEDIASVVKKIQRRGAGGNQPSLSG